MKSQCLVVVSTMMVGLAGLAGCAGPSTDAARRMNSILNIAHRGGIVPGVPENTLAAFRRARDIGVDLIELDLRGTSDGAIVILHDKTLDRTTNGSGPVSGRSLAEIQALDAGGGESVPTYAEVLELLVGTRTKLLLDIKLGSVLNKEQVVRRTEESHAVLDVVVGVRTLADLREFRALNPNLRTLAFPGKVGEIGAFVEAGVDIVRVWLEWIEADPGIVDRVHALGKPVWVTAGDAPEAELVRIVGLGVDGVLSDFPAVLAAVLE